MAEGVSDTHDHIGTAIASTDSKIASTSHGDDDTTQLYHDHTHTLGIEPASIVPRHYKVVYLMKL